MKIECPFCKQLYEVNDQFFNQAVKCTECGKIFQAQPIDNQQVATLVNDPDRNDREVQTNVKQGALIGAGICLLLAICLHCITNFLIILYGPLYFAAFVLSIIAMAQKRIGGGILLLIASITLPGLIFGINLIRFSNEIESSKDAIDPDDIQITTTDKVASSTQMIKPDGTSAVAEKDTNNTTGFKSTQIQSPSKVIPPTPELPSFCGIQFGSKFQPQTALSTGKLTDGVPYYKISLNKYFMDFKDVLVLITPKTKRIHTVWLYRKFSSGSLAREELKKIKAVLEKHYKRQGKQEYFSVDPKYKFEFNNATITLRANILFSFAEIEIIAADKKLDTLADEEAKSIAVEKTDTSVL